MNPKIIVLEGPNGAGKTHVASLLTTHIPNSVVYRPFAMARFGPEKSLRLRRAGVPLNTHADDMYAADAIQHLFRDKVVILDRSLPSGLAYARVRLRQHHADIGNSQSIQAVEDCATMATESEWRDWLELWEDMLGPKKLYVTMLVDYDTANKRISNRERWSPSRAVHDELVRHYVLMHSLVREPRLLVDTAGLESSVARVVDLIFHNLKRLD
jgi:deoxyadenosine/deoxycytidine kinase